MIIYENDIRFMRSLLRIGNVNRIDAQEIMNQLWNQYEIWKNYTEDILLEENLENLYQ